MIAKPPKLHDCGKKNIILLDFRVGANHPIELSLAICEDPFIYNRLFRCEGYRNLFGFCWGEMEIERISTQADDPEKELQVSKRVMGVRSKWLNDMLFKKLLSGKWLKMEKSQKRSQIVQAVLNGRSRKTPSPLSLKALGRFELLGGLVSDPVRCVSCW